MEGQKKKLLLLDLFFFCSFVKYQYPSSRSSQDIVLTRFFF